MGRPAEHPETPNRVHVQRPVKPMGSEEHRELSKDTPVRCAIVTVSDTRSEADDRSGALMRELLENAGHPVDDYRIVPDEFDVIQSTLRELCDHVEVILMSGGTGITRRDGTFEAVSALLEKTLPGFGEIFRMPSYGDVGPASMLSRATAGVFSQTLVFSMPGSTGAVRLAMERLIVPELRHLAWELVRQ
jgi:molybdenum cofactor biosynthesis protein B